MKPVQEGVREKTKEENEHVHSWIFGCIACVAFNDISKKIVQKKGFHKDEACPHSRRYCLTCFHLEEKIPQPQPSKAKQKPLKSPFSSSSTLESSLDTVIPSLPKLI